MAGGFFATNLGGMQILGLEGWRCAFHLVAIVSIITSILVMWLAVDPRRKTAVRPLCLQTSLLATIHLSTFRMDAEQRRFILPTLHAAFSLLQQSAVVLEGH